MNASEMMDEMTASYSEICEQDSQLPAQVTPAERPKVLDLLATTQVSSQEDRLSRLDGQVMKDGEMISFVADDLETKIKLSSPIAYVEPMWNSQLSEGEAKLLEELEVEASILAASVDSLTENLAETLHGISALTVDSLEVYRDVVCKTCDSVDTNIKAMYQLMAKCEEMSKSMCSVSKLAAHIKHIKHLLDLLEATPG
uniref:Uncharacterized protein C17orf59 n=1 Tax=Lygus hesperus TaxID=30085 RepID=A0A0A9Z6H9_LYGHE